VSRRWCHHPPVTNETVSIKVSPSHRFGQACGMGDSGSGVAHS
jgi:hypothetical protein